MPADRKEDIRRHFGDREGSAEFSYVSLGLGMVLGVLLGLIGSIPGVGTVTLGIGGGPLIVALIVGKLRRMAHSGHAAASEHRAAQLRPSHVPGLRRHQRRGRRSCARCRDGMTLLLIGAAVLLTTVLIVLLAATTAESLRSGRRGIGHHR
jgi:putative transport protein